MSLFKTFLALTVAFAASALAESPAPLRVMTFNIRNSGMKDGENHWQYRKDLYVQTVRDFDPDLLGTQEVLADQFEALGTLLPEYTAVGVARDDGKQAGEWAAIYFRKNRFEQLETGNFWLSEKPEEPGSRSWKTACTRICTWARLRDRVSGKVFVYANTHLDHQSELARLEGAKLIQRRLPELAKGTSAILTGDFNSIEDEEPYRVLTNSGGEQGLKLIDSYRTVHPTRAKDEASFNGFKGTVTGSRIDWILHTADFKATAAEIVHPKGDRPASDHFPVTAVLALE